MMHCLCPFCCMGMKRRGLEVEVVHMDNLERMGNDRIAKRVYVGECVGSPSKKFWTSKENSLY